MIHTVLMISDAFHRNISLEPWIQVHATKLLCMKHWVNRGQKRWSYETSGVFYMRIIVLIAECIVVAERERDSSMGQQPAKANGFSHNDLRVCP